MAEAPYNVLFICTGKAARLILAEALLNQLARGRFKAFSAGSHPKGQVHPLALQRLELFMPLPLERLDRMALQAQAKDIGTH